MPKISSFGLITVTRNPVPRAFAGGMPSRACIHPGVFGSAEPLGRDRSLEIDRSTNTTPSTTRRAALTRVPPVPWVTSSDRAATAMQSPGPRGPCPRQSRGSCPDRSGTGSSRAPRSAGADWLPGQWPAAPAPRSVQARLRHAPDRLPCCTAGRAAEAARTGVKPAGSRFETNAATATTRIRTVIATSVMMDTLNQKN